MDAAKCLEALKVYRGLFESRGIDKIDYPHKEILNGVQHGLEHCHGMLDKMREFIQEGRMEKFFRWLGFVQGVLWASGIYPLEDLKNHNRPGGEAE